VFSTLDVASGYWHIPLADKDKEKTAFSTRDGSYQFTVVPFGLTGAPGAFCRAINDTLREFMWKSCLVYVDDIVVWSPDVESFSRLHKNGFQLKLSKCEFFQKKINFLGFVIENGHISVDPAKVEAIKNFAPPQTLTGLQRFLGMVGWYRRFIQDFAGIGSPLFDLLGKDSETPWEIHIDGTAQNKAFVALRDAICSFPVMRLPDFNKPFIVCTDASDYATGAVLAQEHEGFEHLVHFMSRSLNRAQKHKHSYYKELMAVVRALKHFHHYLAYQPFVVATDCRAVAYWNTSKTLPDEMARVLDVLTQYPAVYVHCPGVDMVVPDALSRDER